MSARHLILLVVLLLGIFAPVPAQGQDLSTPNFFAVLFPQLARMEAPAWVREGLRVSYYGASAAIGRDPDEPAPAGGGLLQTDVVGVDRTTIALATRFLLDQGDGTFQPSFSVGETAAPGAGPFWVHPEVLVDADSVAGDGLVVHRTRATYGETEYDVVRFDYERDDDAYAWVFEESTGLLLFYRFDLGENESQGFQEFVGMRRLRLPWRATAAPNWLDEEQTAWYEGSYTTVVAGGDPIPLPLEMEVAVKAQGRRWTLLSATAATAGQAGLPTDRVTGVAQIQDPLWLPAAALSASPRRELIDRDPLTGAELRYRRAGGGVTLSEEGPSWTSRLTYDGATGILLRIEDRKQVGLATLTIDLALRAP